MKLSPGEDAQPQAESPEQPSAPPRRRRRAGADTRAASDPQYYTCVDLSKHHCRRWSCPVFGAKLRRECNRTLFTSTAVKGCGFALDSNRGVAAQASRSESALHELEPGLDVKGHVTTVFLTCSLPNLHLELPAASCAIHISPTAPCDVHFVAPNAAQQCDGKAEPDAEPEPQEDDELIEVAKHLNNQRISIANLAEALGVAPLAPCEDYGTESPQPNVPDDEWPRPPSCDPPNDYCMPSAR